MGNNGNITKISNGHLSETAKQDYTSYAKTMQSNAAKKVNEHSGDGVVFGEPKVKTVKDDTINITVGVFFDGTLNNKTNNQLRDAHNKATHNAPWKFNKEDSYENAPSNVQNLETVYPQKDVYFSVYIEGVGTSNENTDNSYGYGLAYGDTGLIEKVRKGCEEVARQIASAASKQKKQVNQITLDIFGFSRGATCARNFVHEINKPSEKVPLYSSADNSRDYYMAPDNKPRYIPKQSYLTAPGSQLTVDTAPMGNLGQYLKDQNVKYNHLSLRFAGLFDSVSAYGVMHRNDVKELDLNAVDRVAHVVHLTAADEHRDNFELTAVSKGITKTLPGVHSDVGGGYRDSITDKSVLAKNQKEEVTLSLDSSVDSDYKKLIEQAWYKKEELKKEYINDTIQLVGTRRLSNKYSLIPLHLMAEFSERNGQVEINKQLLLNRFDIPSSDPKLNLKDVHERLRQYCFMNMKPMIYYSNPEINALKAKVLGGKLAEKEYTVYAKDHNMLMELRNRYLHYSANYASFGHAPASNNERNVYK